MIRHARSATFVARLALLVALAAASIGCGSTVPPSGPSTPTEDSSPPPAMPSDDVGSSPPVTPGPRQEGQTETDTEVGRIWDTLPTAFPMYPGAARSEEAQTGPTSGVFVVDGDPEVIASWFQAKLAIAGFRTTSLSGPLEDGSLVLDSVGGDPACRLRLTVAPLGSLIAITTLYGAGCALA